MVTLFNVPHDNSGYASGSRCPENATCNAAKFLAAPEDDSSPRESYSLHDLVFSASVGDKLWRGFVLGCAAGLFLAALFCCWAPCFRFGARGALVRLLRRPRRPRLEDPESAEQVARWNSRENREPVMATRSEVGDRNVTEMLEDGARRGEARTSRLVSLPALIAARTF